MGNVMENALVGIKFKEPKVFEKFRELFMIFNFFFFQLIDENF